MAASAVPLARALTAFALAASLLPGCASHIYHAELVKLDQGMAFGTATAQLSQPPTSVHDITVEQTAYRFVRYTMNNGMQAAPYFLAFERGALRYWGYIDDFRRHPDRRLGAAMDGVIAEIRRSQP